MNPARSCPRCYAPLNPAESPEGLCPKCLLAVAMGEDAVIRTQTGAPVPPPPEPADLAPHFPGLDVLSLLGRGGAGAVYRAVQRDLGRQVALKVLLLDPEVDPTFGERFVREARAMASLSHPNIAAVHDAGRAGPYWFLILELIDGPNLRQVIQRRDLAPAEALDVVRQICDALEYAHGEGVVHRDIKPENALMDPGGRIKLVDFGLAKLLGAGLGGATLTGSSQAMGTWHYMAPEQRRRPLDVDHRADIYSLGVVFYELLTGDVPQGRYQPVSQRSRADRRLDAIVDRALEQDPERRYQAASGVREDVERVRREPARDSGSQPESAAASRAPSSLASSPGRGARLALLAMLIAFVGLLAFFGNAYLQRSQRWEAEREYIATPAMELLRAVASYEDGSPENPRAAKAAVDYYLSLEASQTEALARQKEDDRWLELRIAAFPLEQAKLVESFLSSVGSRGGLHSRGELLRDVLRSGAEPRVLQLRRLSDGRLQVREPAVGREVVGEFGGPWPLAWSAVSTQVPTAEDWERLTSSVPVPQASGEGAKEEPEPAQIIPLTSRLGPEDRLKMQTEAAAAWAELTSAIGDHSGARAWKSGDFGWIQLDIDVPEHELQQWSQESIRRAQGVLAGEPLERYSNEVQRAEGWVREQHGNGLMIYRRFVAPSGVTEWIRIKPRYEPLLAEANARWFEPESLERLKLQISESPFERSGPFGSAPLCSASLDQCNAMLARYKGLVLSHAKLRFDPGSGDIVYGSVASFEEELQDLWAMFPVDPGHKSYGLLRKSLGARFLFGQQDYPVSVWEKDLEPNFALPFDECVSMAGLWFEPESLGLPEIADPALRRRIASISGRYRKQEEECTRTIQTRGLKSAATSSSTWWSFRSQPVAPKTGRLITKIGEFAQVRKALLAELGSVLDAVNAKPEARDRCVVALLPFGSVATGLVLDKFGEKYYLLAEPEDSERRELAWFGTEPDWRFERFLPQDWKEPRPRIANQPTIEGLTQEAFSNAWPGTLPAGALLRYPSPGAQRILAGLPTARWTAPQFVEQAEQAWADFAELLAKHARVYAVASPERSWTQLDLVAFPEDRQAFLDRVLERMAPLAAKEEAQALVDFLGDEANGLPGLRSGAELVILDGSRPQVAFGAASEHHAYFPVLHRVLQGANPTPAVEVLVREETLRAWPIPAVLPPLSVMSELHGIRTAYLAKERENWRPVLDVTGVATIRVDIEPFTEELSAWFERLREIDADARAAHPDRKANKALLGRLLPYGRPGAFARVDFEGQRAVNPVLRMARFEDASLATQAELFCDPQELGLPAELAPAARWAVAEARREYQSVMSMRWTYRRPGGPIIPRPEGAPRHLASEGPVTRIDEFSMSRSVILGQLLRELAELGVGAVDEEVLAAQLFPLGEVPVDVAVSQAGEAWRVELERLGDGPRGGEIQQVFEGDQDHWQWATFIRMAQAKRR